MAEPESDVETDAAMSGIRAQLATGTGRQTLLDNPGALRELSLGGSANGAASREAPGVGAVKSWRKQACRVTR